jgi:hypothetical protein
MGSSTPISFGEVMGLSLRSKGLKVFALLDFPATALQCARKMAMLRRDLGASQQLLYSLRSGPASPPLDRSTRIAS